LDEILNNLEGLTPEQEQTKRNLALRTQRLKEMTTKEPISTYLTEP
tara:strand:+ start:500 stop:637 length:138 start_codon:yes stop_codon:yes gene_type:complete